MLYIYPTPQYPRSKLEAKIKTLYSLVNVVTFCCMVVLIVQYANFLQNCLPEYYTNSDLVLAPSLLLVLTNCVYTGEIHLMNVKTQLSTDKNGIILALLQCAQYITALFSLAFVTIVFNGLSLFLYRDGNRHARIFGVHLSLYHGCVAACYFLNFAIIGTTFSFYASLKYFNAAVEYCASQEELRDADAFYDSEFTNYTIFSAGVFFPFVGACFNLGTYLFSFMVRCFLSNKRPEILLSEADAPWERRGLICRTSKPLLSLHTAQRRVILEEARSAMKEGLKVRIARSYQLVTEEDYREMVEAMRKQVEENLKEEQFELLLHNFGEDEEVWDNRGFMWRDSIPWDRDTEANPMGNDDEEDPRNLSSTNNQERSFWMTNSGRYRDEMVDAMEETSTHSLFSVRRQKDSVEGGKDGRPMTLFVDPDDDDSHAMAQAEPLEIQDYGRNTGRRRGRDCTTPEDPGWFSLASPLSDGEEEEGHRSRRKSVPESMFHEATVIRRRHKAYSEQDADELSLDS